MPHSTIRELQRQYRQGELDKAAFIKQAGKLHSQLFSYSELLVDSDIHEVRIRRESVIFSVGEEELQISCPAGEARVAPIEALNFGRYEPVETELMLRLLDANSVIFDVGANIGWFSLVLAARVPGSTVYAFEPVPLFHQHLQLNIERNGFTNRVHAYPTGFSDTCQSVDIFLDSGNGTNASLLNVSNSSTAKAVSAQMYTMDEWCVERELCPDFIKCDVEGAELLVLRGAIGVLKKCVPVIFLEMLRKWSKPFGYHPDDIIRLLSELGYSCFAVGESGLSPCTSVDENTIETNYLFLDPVRHIQQRRRLGLA